MNALSIYWMMYTVLWPFAANIAYLAIYGVCIWAVSKAFFPAKTVGGIPLMLILSIAALVHLIGLSIGVIGVGTALEWNEHPHVYEHIRFASTDIYFVRLSVLMEIALLLSVMISGWLLQSRQDFFFLRKPEGTKRRIATVGLYGFLAVFIVNVAWLLFGPESSDTFSYAEFLARLPASVVVLYGAWFLMVPILEELFFRGLVMKATEQIVGRSVAVVLQALLFALMHNEANDLIPFFIFGCVFGYMCMTLDSIYPSIVVHILHNVLVVYLGVMTGTF